MRGESVDVVLIVRIPMPEHSAALAAEKVLPIVGKAIEDAGWIGKVSASVAPMGSGSIGSEIISPHWSIDYGEGKS